MNLKQWIEDKIRENSWEQRLNEDSPYEDNALSIAKAILKKTKKGKIAVDKKRTREINDLLEQEGRKRSNDYRFLSATSENPINREFIMENGKPDFLGDEPLDWVVENYPDYAKDIIFGNRSKDLDNATTRELLRNKPDDYVHIGTVFYKDDVPIHGQWVPGSTPSYNVNFIGGKGQWTLEELMDEVQRQQNLSDIEAKKLIEEGKLEELQKDFE